ncbi:hypothetical protein F2Q70_00012874 [Brassica cretica]|uniref:FKB95-like N-terminal Kelch domain-containing protein n=1 Tax=Brassica cretica TaxID=69181 RepID=A0A8S9M5Z0_BRACR|nr:hypothetical protein F2Q70_00012874 [Brassica cretica]
MLHSSVQAAASAAVEPPWKKMKPNPSPPSFLSLPDVIILNCLARLPDRPLPSWFTLWIQPDQIEKKKATLVQVPSSYASREPLFLRRVGSDIYALLRPKSFACVLHGKIYVFGGCKANESAESWGEVLDIKARTWEPLPDPGDELRFSSVIRKIEITQGKLYVRSNEEKDSVYDPKTRKWKATPKAREGDSRCMVGNIYYACRAKSCMWYDKECNEWKQVKGLSSFNKNYRSGLIETVNYCGKLLIMWDKLAQPRLRRNCQEKTICCALVALEKRQNGQVWGKVEWSNGVLTVPSSYVFLRSSVIRT